MTARSITVTDVARRFSDVISRVAYRREAFVLTRGGRAVAELRPAAGGLRVGDLRDLLGALPRLTGREAANFAADLNRARKRNPPERLRDPWVS